MSPYSIRPLYSIAIIVMGFVMLVACLLSELHGITAVDAERSPVAEHGGTRDFVEYWAAARLFAQGGNPYSPDELLAVQRSVGWSGDQALILWNPPWTLLLLLPLGFLSFPTGQFVWLLSHVCLTLISAHLLWRIYGKSAQAPRLSWFLAVTFVPTVFVLIIGQITPLVLAGVTAFLFAERKQNWVMMAGCLPILGIKPHLLYLFWLVLLLWMLNARRWRFVVSAALVGFAAALLPFLADTSIYSKYVALYGATGITQPMDWPVPTLRNVIRVLLSSDAGWLQFAPTAVAAVWASWHWHRHKQEWRWDQQLPLLSVVSVASGFFVWTYDHVVLIPALIEGAAWVHRRPEPWYRFWGARLYIVINACHLLMRFWLAEELWYFWLAPALFTNYLIFRWERKRYAAI